MWVQYVTMMTVARTSLCVLYSHVHVHTCIHMCMYSHVHVSVVLTRGHQQIPFLQDVSYDIVQNVWNELLLSSLPYLH